MSIRVYCEHSCHTKEIRKLCSNGIIELYHFPYDSNSYSPRKSKIAMPSAAKIRDLNLSIDSLPASIADYCGSKYFDQILEIVGRTNRRDALHVDSAYKQGCRAFLTQDQHILAHSSKLEALLEMHFFHTNSWEALEVFALEEM